MCVLTMFDQSGGDCYSTVACMCNKQCTQECSQLTTVPYAKCSSQKCMCDMTFEQASKLQDDYFSKPLKLISDKDQDNFQADLVKARVDAPKKKKYLAKLAKIKTAWDAYNTNAAALGLDPATLCNMTCSNECFTSAQTSTQYVTAILTSCLVSQCKCFKPDLPQAGLKGGQDQLVDFTNIVT